jgi:hypothetical protein
MPFDTPRRAADTFDAAAWGRQCAAKAMRSLGLATDKLENGVQEPDAEDEEEAEAEKCFGKDRWQSDKRARDKRRKAAKDGGVDPEPGLAKRPDVAAQDASFNSRYQNAASRIWHR